MSARPVLAGLVLFLLGGAAAAQDRVPSAAEMGRVSNLAADLREAAASTYRSAELFSPRRTRLEARLVSRLLDLQMQAARFEKLVGQDKPEKAALAFTRLAQTYCRVQDDLYVHDVYGPRGLAQPFAPYRNLGPTNGEFLRVAGLMAELMPAYGWSSCGVYGTYGPVGYSRH